MKATRKDILLLLFWVEGKAGRMSGKIEGLLKLMKLAFLLDKEANIKESLEDYYTFEALNFGPFSNELMHDLETLKEEGLIEEEVRNVNTEINIKMIRSDYKLTRKGNEYVRKFIEKIDPAIIEKITAIKGKYNIMGTEKLLTYIYWGYPEFARESKIAADVLT